VVNSFLNSIKFKVSKMEKQQSEALKKNRKAWMGLLSCADPEDLETIRKNLDALIDYIYIVKPETGMIMVQAKADGSKQRFNLGETTISRCILKVRGQYLGASWIMGSSLKHAELAALFDALLQDPEYNKKLTIPLLQLLQEKEKTKNAKIARDAVDTKVEFFTLKRGE